jgi:hypothetical protein
MDLWAEVRGRTPSLKQRQQFMSSVDVVLLGRLPPGLVGDAITVHGKVSKALDHARWLASSKQEAFGSILACGCEVQPVAPVPSRQPKTTAASSTAQGGSTARKKKVTRLRARDLPPIL